MSKPTIICVMGRTASGKTRIAAEVSKRLNIPTVVSYTTRPKRASEINGIDHWFITRWQMFKIKFFNQLVAYTKIGKYEYCVPKIDIASDCIYVIDRNGVDYLRANYSDDFNIKVVYVWCSDGVRNKRALHRSDYSTEWNKRNLAEDEQFSMVEDSANTDYQYFDVMIDNSGRFAPATVTKVIKDLLTDK